MTKDIHCEEVQLIGSGLVPHFPELQVRVQTAATGKTGVGAVAAEVDLGN